MMRGRSPEEFSDELARTDPRFAAFRDECRCEGVGAVVKRHGVDIDSLRSML